MNAITSNKPVNVVIGSNGVMSHYQNYSAEIYKLNLAIAGNLTVQGTTPVANAGLISANGGIGAHGGGSGGSVYLTTGWLAGSGTIRANGGAIGSGGSGGRVALILTGAGADFNSWAGADTARGGAPTRPGAAGTVYRQATADAAGAGTVIVDNGSAALNAAITALPAFAASTEMIAGTVWVTTNMTRIGLVTNAAIVSLNLNANGSLELADRTLMVKMLTVAGTNYKNGTYGPHDTPISALTDAGSVGKVVVYMEPRGTLFLLR